MRKIQEMFLILLVFYTTSVHAQLPKSKWVPLHFRFLNSISIVMHHYTIVCNLTTDYVGTSSSSVDCGTLYAGDGEKQLKLLRRPLCLWRWVSTRVQDHVKKRKEEQHRTKTLNVSFYLVRLRVGLAPTPTSY